MGSYKFQVNGKGGRRGSAHSPDSSLSAGDLRRELLAALDTEKGGGSPPPALASSHETVQGGAPEKPGAAERLGTPERLGRETPAGGEGGGAGKIAPASAKPCEAQTNGARAGGSPQKSGTLSPQDARAVEELVADLVAPQPERTAQSSAGTGGPLSREDKATPPSAAPAQKGGKPAQSGADSNRAQPGARAQSHAPNKAGQTPTQGSAAPSGSKSAQGSAAPAIKTGANATERGTTLQNREKTAQSGARGENSPQPGGSAASGGGTTAQKNGGPAQNSGAPSQNGASATQSAAANNGTSAPVAPAEAGAAGEPTWVRVRGTSAEFVAPRGKYETCYTFVARRPSESLPPPADPAALASSIEEAREYVNRLEDRQSEEETRRRREEALRRQRGAKKRRRELAAREERGPSSDPALQEAADTPRASAPAPAPAEMSGEYGEVNRLARETVAKEKGASSKNKNKRSGAQPEAPTEPKAPVSEIDDIEKNLMQIFDMSDELKQKVGTAEYERIKAGEEPPAPEQTLREEYRSPEERGDFLESYRRKGVLSTVRLALSGLLAVIALLAECFKERFFPAIASGSDTILRVDMLLMLQLTLLIGACALPELVRGFRYLFKGKPQAELVLCTFFVTNVIYEVTVLCTGWIAGARTFNLTLAVCAASAILYTKMRDHRELLAFRVLSSKKKKFVVTHEYSGETSLEKRAFREYLADDGKEKQQIFGVARTSFVDDFVRRCETPGTLSNVLGVLIPAALIAGAVFFALSYYHSSAVAFAGRLAAGMEAAQLAISFLLPTCGFLVLSIPFSKAAAECAREGGAIVGDSSFEEYAGGAVVSFNDEEVFPAGNVRIRSLRLLNQSAPDAVLLRLCEVFAKVGGPLRTVFTNAIDGVPITNDCEILSVDKDGIDAAVDGREVLVGTEEYIRLKGLTPPRAQGDDVLQQRGRICILYLAEAKRLSAKIYLEYVVDREFESVVRALRNSGVCAGVRTLDPCINDTMLDRRVPLSRYPLRVLKCEQRTALRNVSPRASSGVVSNKSVKVLLEALTTCERTLQVTRVGAIAARLLSLAGGLIACILLFATGAASSLNPVFPALYQIGWALLVALVGYLFL